MTTLNEQVIAEVRGDLASFADTHSAVDLTKNGAAWTRQGITYEASFLQSAGLGYPDVRLNGIRQSYPAFLASEKMADLTALAESIFLSPTPEDDTYIEPMAKIEDSEEGARHARTVIADLLSAVPHGATRVVFLRGAAGAGKTVALRQLAHRQADAYLNHTAKFLYLYIDAQARYLARFDDAVALVLQDLNARFTYRALATLTKHRLVVPIIDGFDELLGAGGGGEAVDALTQFLARLGGRGATIASARATYFDFGQIRTSADRFRGSEASFAIVPVELQPWTKREMCAYLEKGDQLQKLEAASSSEALEQLERTFSGNGTAKLFSTPFFLAAAVELAGESAGPDEAARPIRRIIDSFVHREAGKFLNAKDQPILTEEDHWLFLRMLAEEMWWQERRELDKASVDIIAELFADEVGMPDANLRAFMSRASSYAFLATQDGASHTSGPRMLAFSHEYYYAFFVARLLAEGLAKSRDIAGLLGRAQVSPTVAAEFAEHVEEEGPAYLASVLNGLADRRVPVPTRETNRGNAGALYAALLCRHRHITDLRLFEASFTGSDFRDTVQRDVHVESCDFVDTDFRGADWSFGSSTRTTFAGLRVDVETTKLAGLHLKIGADLYGLTHGAGRREYDPTRMAAICEKIGMDVPAEYRPAQPQYSEGAEATIGLLHKLLHVSERMYYLSDDILKQRGLSINPYWPRLEELLRAHDLLEDKKTQKRGPEGMLSRLAYPPRIIAEGEGRTTNPAIREFWKAVRKL